MLYEVITGGADVAGACEVHPEGLVRVASRGPDRAHCGEVHDRVGALARHQRAHRLGIADVEILAVRLEDLAAPLLEPRNEMTAHEAPGSGHEHAHAPQAARGVV